MTITTVELLACPFCGEQPSIHRYSDTDFIAPGASEPTPIPHVFIHCDDCEAGHPPSMFEAEAIKAWNTRTEPTLISNLVKALERIRSEAGSALTDTDPEIHTSWDALTAVEAIADRAIRSNLDKEEGDNG